MDMIHGGDVVGYQIRYGRPPLDFSASLNPLGMPDAVRDAARQAVDDSFAYPDPLCRGLVAALARRLSLPEAYLFCGNGAADVMYRLIQGRKPRTALLTVPTFAEYERALQSVGCRCDYYRLSPDTGFVLGSDILARIAPGLDILFLCQPNNPTGRLADPELMLAVLARCAETGTLLFVDECFCHFVDHPERHSLVRLVRDYPNLFILDSFTKLYGMAGIRLGYGISGNREIMGALSAAGQPWSVSTVAQAAGIAALDEKAYVEKSLRAIREAKRKLLAGLERLGCTVFGADANYIFFHSSFSGLDEALMREGVLIRNCGNFRGLGHGYFRVAVRLEEDNEVLLRAMETVMNGK